MPGTLEAIGLIDGKSAVRHRIQTPEEPTRLSLDIDLCGVKPVPGEKDVLFVHGRILDSQGTLVHDGAEPVTFQVTGPGQLIGMNPVKAEAGIASILLEANGLPGVIEVTGMSGVLSADTVRIQIE